MKTLNDICEAIGSQLAGAKWKIDEADKAANPTWRWFADLTLEQRAVVIEWRPEFGYGISIVGPDDGDSYGTGPDEVYTDPVNVVQRVVELLLQE